MNLILFGRLNGGRGSHTAAPLEQGQKLLGGGVVFE